MSTDARLRARGQAPARVAKERVRAGLCPFCEGASGRFRTADGPWQVLEKFPPGPDFAGLACCCAPCHMDAARMGARMARNTDATWAVCLECLHRPVGEP